MGGPTLADFTTWFYTATSIPTANLPTNSTFLSDAYNVAIATVNLQLQTAPYPNAPLMYTLAVYNLAADRVINFAQDIYGAPLVPNPVADGLPAQVGYFQALRIQFGIGKFTGGVVASSSDEGSSVSLDVVDQMKGLTLAQLQNLKTPWGQTYLGIASSIGTLWGLT